MRTLGAIFGITALAAVAFSSPPAAAFGFRLGPLHFGLPFVGTITTAIACTCGLIRERRGSGRRTLRGLNPDRRKARHRRCSIRASRCLPSSKTSSSRPIRRHGRSTIRLYSPLPSPKRRVRIQSLCQASFDPSAIVGRISNGVMPTADQSQLLQMLGGALGVASGYLAKSCSTEIPAQPVARLQLMESQLEELSMALDIMRQPLLDFEQSLNADQQSRLAVASSQGPPSGNIADGCGSPSAIDWSIHEINQSVQPTTAQRDALDDVRRSFTMPRAILKHIARRRSHQLR